MASHPLSAGKCHFVCTLYQYRKSYVHCTQNLKEMEIRCRKRKYLLKEFCDYVAYTILLFFFLSIIYLFKRLFRTTRRTDTKFNRNENTEKLFN